MKIEKLPSGSYRVRKMYKGQTYTVMFDGKPTQKEAVMAMADELKKVQGKHNSLTFKAAGEKYIEIKKNVLSPSTIRDYVTIMRQIPDAFSGKNIYDITVVDVPVEINRLSKKCSPKTVRNHHGFISAVLSMFYPDLKLIPHCCKRLKVLLISPLTGMYTKFLNMPKELSMKYQLFWPVTVCADQKYVPCCQKILMVVSYI